jgi:hypothetical protein
LHGTAAWSVAHVDPTNGLLIGVSCPSVSRGVPWTRSGTCSPRPTRPRSRRLVEELTWLTTVVVLLALIGIVVWNPRDALRNPEPSKKEKQ